MPSRLGMLIRTDRAIERLDAALARVVDRYAIATPPPTPARDRALRDVERLEYLADVLAAIAADAPAEQPVADSLEQLSRSELNGLAAQHGVDNPGALPNKAAVIAAIDAATEGEG